MLGSQVEIFGVIAYPYWLCYHLGFLLGCIYLMRNSDRMGLRIWQILLLCVIQYVCGFVGARALNTLEYSSDVSLAFSPRAGLTFYGGLILGAIATIAFFQFVRKARLTNYLNTAIIALAIGYSVGRIGCFLSGDSCFGIQTDLPWGLPVLHAHPPITVDVHPAPLYEAFWALCIAAFSHFKLRHSRWADQTFAITLGLLAIERFFVEFVRLNPRYELFSMAQYISLGLIMISITLVSLQFRPKTSSEAIVSQ